jgi:hypothetical protein
MISTRSVGLVIDTVVCLTLAKWETVSGRFGGYLTRHNQQHKERGHNDRRDEPALICVARRPEEVSSFIQTPFADGRIF